MMKLFIPKDENSGCAGNTTGVNITEIKGESVIDIVAEDQEDSIKNTFPVDALNPVQRHAIEYVCEALQMDDLSMAAGFSIAILSASIARTFTLTDKFGKAMPNLWVLSSAPTGCNKSSTANKLKNAFECFAFDKLRIYHEETKPVLKIKKASAERTLANYKKQGRTTKDADKVSDHEATEAQREIDEITPLLSRSPQWIVEQCTEEGLASILERNGEKIFILSTDAGSAVRGIMYGVGRNEKNANPTNDLFLHCLNGESYAGRGRAGSEHSALKSPIASCAWMVQPCIFEELQRNREAIERGVMNRFLFVSPKFSELKPVNRDFVYDQNKLTDWDLSIAYLLSWLDQAPELELKIDPGVNDVFMDLEDKSRELRNGKYRQIEQQFTRITEHAKKLAIGQWAIDNAQACIRNDWGMDGMICNQMTVEQARRGCKLAEWFMNQAAELFGNIMSEKKSIVFAKILNSVPADGIKVRDLLRATHCTRKEFDFLMIEYRGKLIVKTTKTAGRPSEVVFRL